MILSLNSSILWDTDQTILYRFPGFLHTVFEISKNSPRGSAGSARELFGQPQPPDSPAERSSGQGPAFVVIPQIRHNHVRQSATDIHPSGSGRPGRFVVKHPYAAVGGDEQSVRRVSLERGRVEGYVGQLSSINIAPSAAAIPRPEYMPKTLNLHRSRRPQVSIRVHTALRNETAGRTGARNRNRYIQGGARSNSDLGD